MGILEFVKENNKKVHFSEFSLDFPPKRSYTIYVGGDSARKIVSP